MKKIFLTLAISLAALFLLTFSVFATEYTVNSNEEYAAAYESATNGDTIVVAEKLTCDIYANKSITYVLKADWESARFVINQSNVEVSFIADGGNYRIMPTNYSTTDGWLNISEAYTNVVINFGGKNGGTVTIDGSNATHDRVSYVTASANVVLNLLNGSAIANFNNKTKDDNISACIIYAHTVNMYDGCKIYGNNVISAPLIKTTYFNMFGGEIFGNLLTSTRFQMRAVGAIYADKQFTMYGGNIYDNVIKATHASNYQFSVAGFITTDYGYRNGKVVIYNGEIGNLYVFGDKGNNCTSLFGIAWRENPKSYFYYNTGIETGTQYQFTDEPAFTYDQNTGKTIWQVENTTVLNENYYGYCWDHNIQAGNNVAIFLNAEKKNIAGTNFDVYSVINAYIDGVYANRGSTTISIPSGYDIWSISGTEYCHTGRAYTLDEVKAANAITLYAAYNAEIVTVNGVTQCSGCGKVYTCDNPNHNQEILSISYESYEKQGEKVVKCNTCNVVSTLVAPKLFTCLGYSAPEDGRNGITVGYTVNNDAINEYEQATGKTINYGVFAVRQEKLGDSPLFDENNMPSKGVASTDITSYRFLSFDLKIVGFENEHKDTKFAMGAYVVTKNGDTTEYVFLQAGAISENARYHFASYNEIIDLIPDEVVEFEDISIKTDEEIVLPSTVNVNGIEKEITYSFEGNGISIENNVLKGLVMGSETIVTVTGKKVTGTFKVKVEADYKYVVVIGVDGAGTFFKNANTPNIDAIFAKGAITYDCLTANPTISAQCWGSLLHGVVPSVHGLTNAIVESTAYPTDSKYPSFFRVIRENDENAVLASFCNWKPINVGIIENNIGVNKGTASTDAALTTNILAYLADNNPTALFVQFDEADGTGHSYGYGSDSQLAKISEIDSYIGQIYAAYEQNGILDETLFIVTSDHGGTGKSHGGNADSEKYVMFAAAGKNVQKGTIGEMEIRDTASIVLHALGYENPETWTSRVPSGLFKGVIAGERPEYVDKDSNRYHETVATPEKGSSGYVTNFVDNELKTYLTFDGNINDSCGGTTTQGGKLYFTEDGYFGQGVAVDDGYVSLNDFKPGTNSFTISLWINSKTITSDPCVISNKNWNSGRNLGFALTIRSGKVDFNFGNGSDNIVCTAQLPTDYTDGWMHIIAFVDRENGKIGVCVDFGAIVTLNMDGDWKTLSMDTDYVTNIGQDGTGNYGVKLPATVDEVMIFKGAFDANDVNNLKAYYGLIETGEKEGQ